MGGNKTDIQRAERINNLQIVDSAQGVTLPVIYGRNRVGCNLIWYGDFTTYEHRHEKKFGNWLTGKQKQVTITYSYTAAAIFALSEGVIAGVNSVWRDKERLNLVNVGMTFFNGNRDQAAWGHLQNPRNQAQLLNYSGTSFVCAAALPLSDNGRLSDYQFEVSGKLAYSGTVPDANPADILNDILTNPDYGCGFPAENMESLGHYNVYCRAYGIFTSPAYTGQETARKVVLDMLHHTNSAAVFSQGRLKIIPYGDTGVSGNGTVYVPNNNPVYDLGYDDFIVSGTEDPVSVERKTNADAFNLVQVEYSQREHHYDPAVVEAKDQASIEKYGLRAKDVIKIHAICNAEVAGKVANFILQRELHIRNTYEFKLGWKYCLLEPMDLVTLTDAGLGLDKTPVRITEIEEAADGTLSIKAEDFVLGTAGATFFPTQPSLGYIENHNVEAGNVFTPSIFEPSLELTGSGNEIWIAAAGGENWGGAQVYMSLNGTDYRNIGELKGKARYGELESPLTASSSLIDNKNLLNVAISSGQLLTAKDEEVRGNLCYVGGELLTYKDAKLRAAGRYALSKLTRGQYGSDVVSHPAKTPFVYLDETVFRHEISPELIGKTVYFKLASFNVFGSHIQALDRVKAYPYLVVGGKLADIANLRQIAKWGYGEQAVIGWDNEIPYATYDVEVYNADGGQLLRRANIKENRFTYSIADMQADGGGALDLEFRVRIRYGSERTGAWAQISAVSPAVGNVPDFIVANGMRGNQFARNLPLSWGEAEYAKTYELEIHKGSGSNTLLRSFSGMTGREYRYMQEQMQKDRYLARVYRCKVRGVSLVGKKGAWAEITATNPQVAPVAGLSVEGGLNQGIVSFNQPADVDCEGVMIWVSENPQCPTVDENKVYDGQRTFFIITKCNNKPLVAGKNYYARVAGYDNVGKDGLNAGNSVAFQVFNVNAIAKELTESNLAKSLNDRINSIPEEGLNGINERVGNAERKIQQESATRERELRGAADKAARDLTAKAAQIGTRIEAVERINTNQAQQLATVTAAHGNTAAGLESEKRARVQGDQAEAAARAALATRVGNAESGITALERSVSNETRSRAEQFNTLNARFDGLSVGGRNLLKKSGETSRNSDYQTAKYEYTDALKEGEDFTLTIWGKLGKGKQNFRIHNSNGYVHLGNAVKVSDGLYRLTGKWIISHSNPERSSDNRNLYIYHFPKEVMSDAVIDKVKLERGTMATDWTPAPEDGEASVAAVAAALTEHKAAQVTKDAAAADNVRTLTAKVAGAEAKVTQSSAALATLNGKVQSMYTLKTETIAGGRRVISGLALGADGKTGDSQVLVYADKFAIVDPRSKTMSAPFIVKTENGRATVALDGRMLVNGSIHGEHIAAGQTLTAPVIRGGTLEIDSLIGGNIYEVVAFSADGKSERFIDFLPSKAHRIVKFSWPEGYQTSNYGTHNDSERDWVTFYPRKESESLKYTFRRGLMTIEIPPNTGVGLKAVFIHTNIITAITCELMVVSGQKFIVLS